MTLQGDLATLELADIVQNLEMHRRSGTLAVEGPRGTTRIYLEEGAATLLAADGRPELADDLVRAGLVTERDLERARKSRWRTRKSLGEVLVKRKAIDADVLHAFAEERLREDLCDFLVLEAGAFTFTEEKVPRRTFDPEERALGLRLQLGVLLFEAARRKDHWPLLRRSVPSDAAHHQAPDALEPPEGEDPELGCALFAQLDGTRNVREVMRAFPHRRFDAYEMLARLVAAQTVRALGPDDLVALARELADGLPDRAWQVVRDGLATHGHHVGLLREKVALAAERGEDKAAAEALKLIAHGLSEAGDRAGALVELQRAADLDPDDTSIWERTFALALEDERADDAAELGLHLVELYRKPGLHSRAVGVLESLVKLDPDRLEIQRELARARVDCGNTTGAVGGLERYGRKLLTREDYTAAREVQEEILRLVPSRKQARETIERIDAQVFQRRRAWRRRMARRLALFAVGAGLAGLLALDVRARVDHARAERGLIELIEVRRYDEAIAALEEVRARHPYTPTAWLALRGRIADLKARRTVAPRD
jgi:tetratricopeptide (TPR) repeat protein